MSKGLALDLFSDSIHCRKVWVDYPVGTRKAKREKMPTGRPYYYVLFILILTKISEMQLFRFFMVLQVYSPRVGQVTHQVSHQGQKNISKERPYLFINRYNFI